MKKHTRKTSFFSKNEVKKRKAVVGSNDFSIQITTICFNMKFADFMNPIKANKTRFIYLLLITVNNK
jgi:hypothetical protein